MRLALGIFLSLVFNFLVSGKEVYRLWTVTTASYLEINGTTNISNFQCDSPYYIGSDMIREVWNSDLETWEITGTLLINIDEFNCQNRMMTNDFKTTLKSHIYPEIEIKFLNLKKRKVDETQSKAEGWVEITLAGKSMKYFLTIDLTSISNQHIVFSGQHDFHFSDFDMVPPQKGFGLVRVSDEISVGFKLILEQIAFSGF